MHMKAITCGALSILPLSDGYIDLNLVRAFPGVQAAAWQAWPESVVGENLRCWLTSYLIRAGEQMILVDTGLGPRLTDSWRGEYGTLPRSLADAGVAPEQIDTVVTTHLHADHLGWNCEERDGVLQPTFPRARYVVHKDEWPRWADSDDRSIARCVRPLLAAGRLEWLDEEGDLVPGVRLLATPGHTPGHVSVLVYDRGEGAVVTGDASHHPAQIEHPEWSPTFDADPARAAQSRTALVERIEAEGLAVLGGHYPPPHAGRVLRVEQRRVYRPV
jgi:glyoxylase-like metal-dependent hydrolase (beta-lactamase superfamily II)